MQRYAPSLDSSPTTTTVWTAGALLRAVGRKLPDKVTTADFYPGLYAVKDDTLGGLVGPLTFNAGKAASPITCVFQLKVVDHRFTAPAGSQQQCFQPKELTLSPIAPLPGVGRAPAAYDSRHGGGRDERDRDQLSAGGRCCIRVGS
jgi:hypothetical protein